MLHNDDVDNINCLFSGVKELLFIEYKKYKDKVGYYPKMIIRNIKTRWVITLK